jgi:tetratricopeptide (TPR) repeat protein
MKLRRGSSYWCLLGISSLLISSCSFWAPEEFEHDAPDVAVTLASLPAATPRLQTLERLSLNERITQLENLEVDAESADVAGRLAQLRLHLMEQELEQGEANYAPTIAALQNLRDITIDPTRKAAVDYQLARVMSMAGSESATDDAVLNALTESIRSRASSAIELEARFRRAEIYFARGQFALAEEDFGVVAAAAGEFNLHAKYLLAWSRFKQSDHDGTLQAGLAALAEVNQQGSSKYAELNKDLLRVMVLALDYQDGPLTLANLMRDTRPDYQTDVYRALGDWYLSKNRFADSALTWQTFLTENPLHRDAPNIALEVIATQREAGFVADIPQLEEDFILNYGKQAEFFAVNGSEVFVTYERSLREMLDRYSQRFHAKAQTTGNAEDYINAAAAYEVWLTNFPAVAATQEKYFLYAETLEAGKGFGAALPAYEAVLAMDHETRFAREAAYAVALGANQLLTNEAARQDILAAIDANLRFARLYSDDLRAPSSQLSAAKHLYEQAIYQQANEAATTALTLNLDQAGERVAKRLIAHSAFALADYAAAESTYRELEAAGDDTREQILAAVFKQAELAETAGDLASAIEHLQRLREVAPRSALARDAMYDIALLYEQLDNLPAASQQLELYRKTYPQQTAEMGQAFILRLAGLKETQGDVTAAAEELLRVARGNEAESARVARFRAAELFLQSGDLDRAIEHFRYYAHNHPEPAAVRFEAMQHMDELYQTTAEPQKRTYWLHKKRDLYKALEIDERSERIRYLAAEATYRLSEPGFQKFAEAKLNLPLQRSLQAKQKLLNQSLANYRAVIEIGVVEFSTQSYLRMAQHFQVLSQDLLDAEQPRGLNPLEQEQYEILLEEQAFPFEEKAISLHEQNLRLGWEFGWNDAVNESLLALQKLFPAKFQRPLMEVAYVDPAK